MIHLRFIASLLLGLALIGLITAQAQTAKPMSAFEPVRFLIGHWVGGGNTQAGQGQGEFSIQEDLAGQVLIRRDHTDYPATKDKPAMSMDVLMIIYAENKELRATYFDNEGHVIHYQAPSVVPGVSVQFVSAVTTGAPTFRLTYTKSGGDEMAVKFEIAPPGKPDAFTTYAEGKARRKS